MKAETMYVLTLTVVGDLVGSFDGCLVGFGFTTKRYEVNLQCQLLRCNSMNGYLRMAKI